MKIHILSDLHLEFGPVELPDISCDVVVLAGDVATKGNGLRWIRERYSVPVIYLCGNHEYYGAKYPGLLDKLRQEADGTQVHVLENAGVTIGDIHFFGCTLWTDMALQGDWTLAAAEAWERMNDYKRIRNSRHGYRKLRPVDTRNAHLASREALTHFLRAHDPARSVIVTHHAPSRLSLPESRRPQLISAAYASEMDDFIRTWQPALWIHGHIHHSQDYQIGRTRVLANPRAYPDDPNPGFDPALVVQLP